MLQTTNMELKAISSSNVFMKKGKKRSRVIIVKKNIAIEDKDGLIDYLRQQMNLNDKEFYAYLQSKELV